MRSETINAIESIAKTDPEATPEIIRAIMRVCRNAAGKPKTILAKEAMALLEVSRPTLRAMVKNGRLSVYKPTPHKCRFYVDEINACIAGER